MQPRDLEVLDLEAADHRASHRQPANCQGADGPGANSRRPGRGRADADRCQEHRRRLLAAATTKLHRTVGASSAVHAMVLQWSKVGVGFRALPLARPHFGVVIPMTYTVGPDSSTRPRTVKITIYGWGSRVMQRLPRWRMASVQVRRHYGSSARRKDRRRGVAPRSPRPVSPRPPGRVAPRSGCTTGATKRGDAIFASVQVRRLNATLPLLGAGRSGVAAWERAGQCRRAAKRRAAR